MSSSAVKATPGGASGIGSFNIRNRLGLKPSPPKTTTNTTTPHHPTTVPSPPPPPSVSTNLPTSLSFSTRTVSNTGSVSAAPVSSFLSSLSSSSLPPVPPVTSTFPAAPPPTIRPNDDFAFLLAQSRAMLDAANADDEDSVLAALRTTKPVLPSQSRTAATYDPLPPPPPPPPRTVPMTPSTVTPVPPSITPSSSLPSIRTDNRVPLSSLTALDTVLNRTIGTKSSTTNGSRSNDHHVPTHVTHVHPTVATSTPSNISVHVPANPYTYGSTVSSSSSSSSSFHTSHSTDSTPMLSSPFPTYSVPSSIPVPIPPPFSSSAVPSSSSSLPSSTTKVTKVSSNAFHSSLHPSSTATVPDPAQISYALVPSSASSIVSGSQPSHSTALTLPKHSLGQPPPMVSSTGVVALPRSTLSTRRLISQYGDTIGVYLGSLPRNIAIAIRELIIDILHLRAKRDTMLVRVMNDKLRKPTDPMPEVLLNILDEMEEREKRITAIAGEERTIMLLQLIEKDERNARITMGLSAEPETEEELGNTVNRIGGKQAGVFRRRLDTRNVQPARKERPDAPLGGVMNTALDGINADGSRQLFTNGIGGVGGVKGRGAVNDTVSRRNGSDNISYYARQQQRYGRGRRGSTSIASAWQQVFASAENNNEGEHANGDPLMKDNDGNEHYTGIDSGQQHDDYRYDGEVQNKPNERQYQEHTTRDDYNHPENANAGSYPPVSHDGTHTYAFDQRYPPQSESVYPPQPPTIPSNPYHTDNPSYSGSMSTPSHSVPHAVHTFSQQQSSHMPPTANTGAHSGPAFDIDSMLADATALMALLRSNQSP